MENVFQINCPEIIVWVCIRCTSHVPHKKIQSKKYLADKIFLLGDILSLSVVQQQKRKRFWPIERERDSVIRESSERERAQEIVCESVHAVNGKCQEEGSACGSDGRRVAGREDS